MEAILPHAVRSLGPLQSHRDGLTHLVHQSHGAQQLGPLTCPVVAVASQNTKEEKAREGQVGGRSELQVGGR